MRGRGSQRGDIREERGAANSSDQSPGTGEHQQWSVVSGEEWSVAGGTCQGWPVLVNGVSRAQGESMVSTCQWSPVWHETPGEQGIGQPPALYHWSVRRSHWTGDFTNLRKLREKLWQNLEPSLATLGGSQRLGWSELLICFDMRIIINCFVFSLSASPISNILNL